MDMAKKILLTGMLLGCMDGAAACINGYLSFGVTPARVFRYIASGLLGPHAFSGSFGIILLGIWIHLFIAVTVTAVFFLLYMKIFPSPKYYLYHGALYGILVWVVMNLIVVPLSAVHSSDPPAIQITIQLLIHIFVIGIPLSYLAYNGLLFNRTANRKRSAYQQK